MAAHTRVDLVNPEKLGGPCAVILVGLVIGGTVWATANGLPRPEGLLALAALILVKLWALHRDALREPSTIGDKHWRDAVRDKLPEMVRGAKVWGAQIVAAADQATEIARIAPPESMTFHPWGVEVALWPPAGRDVDFVQSGGVGPLFTALGKPLADMGEPLALVDVVHDPDVGGRARLRILPSDPFEHPRPWEWALTDGPMGDRLGPPLGGWDRYGAAVWLPQAPASVIVAGIPNSGKSTGGLVAHLRQYFPTQTAIVGIDTVGFGVDLAPMRPRLAGLYMDRRDVLPVVESLSAERLARVRVMVANGMTKLETDEDFRQLARIMGRPTPPICLAIDEAHDAFPLKSDETAALKTLIKEARKAGIWVLFATQRVSHTEMDTSLRALFAAGVCFHVANQTDAAMCLGALPPNLPNGPWRIKPSQRGMCYVKEGDATGGAAGAGGLVAVRSIQLDVGSKRSGKAYPEVAASAVATADRAPRLPWLPTPR